MYRRDYTDFGRLGKEFRPIFQRFSEIRSAEFLLGILVQKQAQI
jgi:hypothetical protein